MAKFSTKHKDREQTFSIRTFSDGLSLNVAPLFLSTAALTECMNMKYAVSRVETNQFGKSSGIVTLKKRQGTERISVTALTGGADVMACTKYVAGGKYVVATSSKLYYLDASYAPVEIGSISGVPTFSEFKGKLIIHDSGTTKAWNGTTFETLTCYYKDVAIETGDGGTVDFTGTLTNVPIKPGSVVITYTDTTEKTITDSAGALIGDIDAGGTNTIDYTTGAYSFRCSGAPDNTTSVYASYEKVAGAPKSKAGMVRANRLYVWGDSDNPSRIWYSGTNDEDAWDSTSSGGYVDVDPLDGYSLTGAMNFFTKVIIVKGNSLHSMVSYPGETDFAVVPLIQDLGGNAYKACMNVGTTLTFMTKEGFIGMGATDAYGDIKKTADLSEKFQDLAVRYSNAYAYCDYNQIDKQIWLTLYDAVNSAYLPQIFVINMETGGQISQYRFNFAHSCYTYVDGEMLIGGTDGHLYRLLNRESRFRDNGVSYASDTYIRGSMSDFGLPANRKHNKELYAHLFGQAGGTATLNLYKDGNYIDAFDTMALTVPMGDAPNYYYQDVLNYDLDEVPTGWLDRLDAIKRKFSYYDVMFELTNITGALGFEVYGIDFKSAILGG